MEQRQQVQNPITRNVHAMQLTSSPILQNSWSIHQNYSSSSWINQPFFMLRSSQTNEFRGRSSIQNTQDTTQTSLQHQNQNINPQTIQQTSFPTHDQHNQVPISLLPNEHVQQQLFEPTNSQMQLDMPNTPLISFDINSSNVWSAQHNHENHLPSTSDVRPSTSVQFTQQHQCSSDKAALEDIKPETKYNNTKKMMNNATELLDLAHGKKVKPWIELDSPIKEELRLQVQLDLFKCMHAACNMSSEESNKLINHIDFLRVRRQIQNHNNYGDCSYCENSYGRSGDLIDHIEKEHKNSIFQCANCFYRTIEIENIITHNERFHKGDGLRTSNGLRQILLCSGERVIDENSIKHDRFKKTRGKSLLTCERCEFRNLFFLVACIINLIFFAVFPGDKKKFSGCFSFGDLHKHLDEQHKNQPFICGACDKSIPVEGNAIEKHLEKHGLFEFMCIHCKTTKSFNDVVAMKLHMADDHPGQFLYAASRRIESKSVDLSGTYLPETIKLYEIGYYTEKLGVWKKIEWDSPFLNTIDRLGLDFTSKDDWPMSYDKYLSIGINDIKPDMNN